MLKLQITGKEYPSKKIMFQYNVNIKVMLHIRTTVKLHCSAALALSHIDDLWFQGYGKS